MIVSITAPARLHIGLIDVGHATARLFGGVGVTVAEPQVAVTAVAAARTAVIGASAGQARAVKDALERLARVYGRPLTAGIRIERPLPEHIGLGSKTATLLAVLRAAAGAYEWAPEPRILQAASGRGGTSGIGIHAFFHGGFLFDGGHSDGGTRRFEPSSSGPRGALPPLLTSVVPPRSWRITLVEPPAGASLWGRAERAVFARAPVSSHDVLHILAAVYHGILPAIRLDDLGLMADAIDVVNRSGFKRLELEAQGLGVMNLLTKIRHESKKPAGMSSMGPTLFVIHRYGDGVAEIVGDVANSQHGRVIITTEIAEMGYSMSLDAAGSANQLGL